MDGQRSSQQLNSSDNSDHICTDFQEMENDELFGKKKKKKKTQYEIQLLLNLIQAFPLK